MTEIEDLLQKTSRTFALTIPLLPEPTRAEVGVAYLLFRVIDTFEDATRWDGTRKIEALNRFVHLVGQPPAQAVELAADCGRDPPLNHPGYLELLSKLPQVLQAFAGLEPRAQAIIHEHVRRSADGMGEFVAREAASGRLQLHDLDDLRDYCYTVAGIVGEMLTELYQLGRPFLAPAADYLRNRAADFGEGLQLVNILKDAGADAAEGRTFLPGSVDIQVIFALARRDLARAAQYTDVLRAHGAEPGLIAFNALISRLAATNLQILSNRGLGAKLSRLEVARIAAEVAGEVGQTWGRAAEL